MKEKNKNSDRLLNEEMGETDDRLTEQEAHLVREALSQEDEAIFQEPAEPPSEGDKLMARRVKVRFDETVGQLREAVKTMDPETEDAGVGLGAWLNAVLEQAGCTLEALIRKCTNLSEGSHEQLHRVINNGWISAEALPPHEAATLLDLLELPFKVFARMVRSEADQIIQGAHAAPARGLSPLGTREDSDEYASHGSSPELVPLGTRDPHHGEVAQTRPDIPQYLYNVMQALDDRGRQDLLK